MYCESCGQRLGPSAAFCAGCGTPKADSAAPTPDDVLREYEAKWQPKSFDTWLSARRAKRRRERWSIGAGVKSKTGTVVSVVAAGIVGMMITNVLFPSTCDASTRKAFVDDCVTRGAGMSRAMDGHATAEALDAFCQCKQRKLEAAYTLAEVQRLSEAHAGGFVPEFAALVATCPIPPSMLQ